MSVDERIAWNGCLVDIIRALEKAYAGAEDMPDNLLKAKISEAIDRAHELIKD